MEAESNTKMKKIVLIVNCIILAIGNAGGPLISRLYFIHGGKRVWFSSFLQTAGWPMILIPLFISYFQRRQTQGSEAKLLLIKPISFLAFLIIGLLTGLDDYFYAYGVARLPVSTTSLIIASQLAFTAAFAFLLVKQKFTPYSINAIVLLTIGASILAFHNNGSDRPKGEPKKEYIKGFLMTLAASCLYGFILPLIQFSNNKAKQDVTYSLVLESQMVMCFFATAFCALGMLINNDFQAISREAREFELGETKYYVIIVSNMILWQAYFLGAIGVIFCASSLLSGNMISVLLPVVEVLAVIFYDEKFQVEKGVALVLSLWGLISYFYGEIKYNKKQSKQIQETEVPHIPTP